MPTKRPEYLPGRFYHFYNRGAHHLSIFREADNCVFVLRKMRHYCRALFSVDENRALSLTPIAYCLLPNHYHYLIRQDGEQPAGFLPQRVYNKRYGHSGTLFEGNYRVIPVEVEGYLLHLCRYIHANPVLHGLVDDVAGWPYSNYPEWIGERQGTLVDREHVRAHFPQPQSYKAFVAEYLAHRRMPDELTAHLRNWEA
jgi:putative transposase